jgi:hypothetical protein
VSCFDFDSRNRMQRERAVPYMSRVRTMACVLVAITLMVTLLCGSAIAAIADNRRKIIMFNNPPDQDVIDDMVLTGITVLHDLSLINALAVQLPPPPLVGPDPALALLQILIDLGVVQEVIDDTVGTVDGGRYSSCIDPASLL